MNNNFLKNLSLPLISVLGIALTGCGNSGINALENKANPARIQPITSSTLNSAPANPVVPAAVGQVSTGTAKNSGAGNGTVTNTPGAEPTTLANEIQPKAVPVTGSSAK